MSKTKSSSAKIGSEIIHILLDTQPSTNITCVYQKTGITKEEADEAHKVLNEKVQKRVNKGEDYNNKDEWTRYKKISDKYS